MLHPQEIGRQSSPAQCPVLGQFLWAPFKPVPSLRAPRCLRRHQRYYEPVRRPTSAQREAPVLPCFAPPPVTKPMDPVGPPGFRKRPFVCDAIQDPGGATPSRVSDGVHAAFAVAKQLGLRIYKYFGACYPHLTRSLCTLQTIRYRMACNTRYRAVRWTLPGQAFQPASHLQLIPAHVE